MTQEYITKNRAKQFVCGHCKEVCGEKPCEPSDCDWMAFIDKEPAADVAPVVHGRWIEYPVAHYFKCSNCKYTVPYRKAALLNGKRSYTCCPHCHAVMDLKETKEQKEITSQEYHSDQKRLAEEDPDFLWGWWY